MKIKKFVGSSMPECILKVKRELGENAMILDSRKVRRGGAFSFLRTDLVEVIAATEGGPPPKGGIHPTMAQRVVNAEPRETESTIGGDLLRASEDKGKVLRPDHSARKTDKLSLRETPNPEALALRSEKPSSGQRSMVIGPPSAANALEFSLISEDLQGLKETVQQITDHLRYRQMPSMPVELEKLHRELLENGVETGVAAAITGEMTLSLAGGDFEDGRLLKAALHERVGKIVRAKVSQWDFPSTESRASKRDKGDGSAAGAGYRHRPRVIALIGPTGVGKTTTLAKMATHPSLYGRRKVALVSADTYRIAAVEQLKTFASIANLPMEAVYRPTDIKRAVERFGDYEVILIDTAGRSQNDRGQLNDLAAFMEYAQCDEVHLVLSISTRLEDQMDVLAKFSAVNPKALIFTKLDETTSYGMMLNVCHQLGNPSVTGREPGTSTGPTVNRRGNLPVSLLTCGQNVPDDVLAPSQSQLVRLVCERGYFKGLRTNA